MQDAPLDIRDIKPLVPVPAGVPWGWLALAALLLVTLAALVIWWRQRAAPPKPARPLEAPDVVALRRLRALDPARVGRGEGARALYFAVSEILRAYVEARFGVNATDLTSSEIRERLTGAPALARAELEALLALLEEADFVKFAKREAGVEDCRGARERACDFVAATRAASAPVGGAS